MTGKHAYPTWEFEAADPEVGFLSDTVTHTCEQNEEDAQPAEIVGVDRWSLPDGKTVREQTVFKCPACEATTTSVDDFPVWMFEEEPADGEVVDPGEG